MMRTLLVIGGVVVAFVILTLVELLIQAWREIDDCEKEIERLKRQGITQRDTEMKEKV